MNTAESFGYLSAYTIAGVTCLIFPYAVPLVILAGVVLWCRI